MTRIWEDAASILETATAAGTDARGDVAILVDASNHMRIVDACGWNADSLQREYRATTVYTVRRTGASVTVEAQNGSEKATLSKSVGTNPMASLMSTVPHHLVRQERSLAAAK